MIDEITTAEVDIAIFGGGVAGLWLLNRLRALGYSVLLFETDSLGGGQTMKSQGIIHGGMKYALQGVFTNDAKAMLDMPVRWQQCLEGRGDIDLTHVPVLSQQHYLWSPGKLVSKITGFLASTTLSSKVNALPKNQYPAVFQHSAFKGEVYALDELVIDVPALVCELSKAHQDVIFKVNAITENDLTFDEQGKLVSIHISYDAKSIQLNAQQFIFTAGAGNELLAKTLTSHHVATQRRPLHMVMVKAPAQFPLYAHCLGFGSRPRMTITTHYLQDGSAIWYMGGLIAEDGIHKSSVEQIKATKVELKSLFPWLDFSEAEFASFMVDRAEPLQANGFKPETSFSQSIQNITVAWPTKLALAPKLADEIMQSIAHVGCIPHAANIAALSGWPKPSIATPVWEDMFCNNVN